MVLMRRGIAGVLIGLAVGTAVPVLTATASRDNVPASVIDSVHGKKSTGFTVRYGDGSKTRYPSLRRALLECEDGRDTEGPVAYGMCVGSVRAEYEGLREMRRTLNAKGVNR